MKIYLLPMATLALSTLPLSAHAFDPVNPVPEPSTFLLIALGMAGLGLSRYKKK